MRYLLIAGVLVFGVLLIPAELLAVGSKKDIMSAFSSIPGATVGDRVIFKNKIDSIYCYPLHVDDTFVAWVYSAYNIGKTIVMMKCVGEEGYDKVYKPNRSILGYLDLGLFRVERNKKWGLSKIPTPGYAFLSNPSFCGEWVGYWGLEHVKNMRVPADYNKADTTGVVYNLNTGEVIRKHIDVFVIETDYAYHLKRPEWNEKCEAISFFSPIYMKSPVVIELNGN